MKKPIFALLFLTGCALDVQPEVAVDQEEFILCNAQTEFETWQKNHGCQRFVYGTDRIRYECYEDDSGYPTQAYELHNIRRVWNIPTLLDFDQYKRNISTPRQPLRKFAYGNCDCGRPPVSPGVNYCMFIAAY